MSKMLDEFMKRFEQSVVEGKENLEAREAAEKKAADEAALEEQRLIKEEQELLERRRTRLGELAANLKYLPMVEKIIDMHYLVDGITVFARTTDGNAYEFMIRPAEYAKGFSNYRKPSKPVKEEQSEPQFPSSTRVRELTREIADAYGGMYDWRYPRVWTRFPMGVRNRDPEHWVKFKTPEELESAWGDLSTKGKVLHIKDSSMNKARPHLKIGKFIIGRVGNSLYVQTTSILRNTPIRKQEAAPVEEEQVNEISLKTKVNAYSRAMDPEFDYYADGTHNPDRKLGQAERIRAIIAKKHGEEAADQADDQAAYDHYGDYMFKDRKVPAHVKQREPVTELSDKRLKKYVKKATKSADSLQYYSDSRNDPDWEKAQKRKKMVDVAKKKLGEESFPYDVDHMSGPTVDKLSKGCTTCNGHKVVYKLPDGSVRADNVKGAKRIACPTCKGTGGYTPKKWVKENSSDAARIVVKPTDLTHPDDDGAVERAPKDKDVAKSIKDTSRRYDVHVVKDFGKYTKNK